MEIDDLDFFGLSESSPNVVVFERSGGKPPQRVLGLGLVFFVGGHVTG